MNMRLHTVCCSVIGLIFILILYLKSWTDYQAHTELSQYSKSTSFPASTKTTVSDYWDSYKCDSTACSTTFSGIIHMDWTLESDKFNYINYKSLESLLFTYPQSKVVISMIAPFQAHYYKVGNQIHKHYFQKYVRFGYNVDLQIKFQQYGSGVANIRTAPPPGAEYWNRQMSACCMLDNMRSLRDDIQVPFHMYFYNRLLSLRQQGGLFSDFSWLHSSPVQWAAIEGVVIRTVCEPDMATTRSLDRLSNMNRSSSSTGGKICSAATFMRFDSNSSVLLCMLAKYNESDTGAFMRCLQSDSSPGTEGISCLEAAFNDCFLRAGVTNNLATLLSKDQQSEINKYHTALWTDSSISGAGGQLSSTQLTRENLLRQAVLWLGPAALRGDWSLPDPSSPLAQLLHKTKLVVPHKVASVDSSQHKRQQCVLNATLTSRASCHHFQIDAKHSSAQHQRQATTSCAPDFVLAGFMKAGTTYLFEVLMTHPQTVKALRGVLFKETGCYLPAQMTHKKAPLRMNCFPFLEPADSALRYGDGTVYYAARKELPGYLLGDNPDVKVLFTVRNPVRRTESHHRFSYKLFLVKKMGDINQCISVALDRERGSLMDLFDLAVAADADHSEARSALLQALLQTYQQGIKGRAEGVDAGERNKQYHHCANLVFHSLYLPPLLHWFKMLPQRNLLVVVAERLDPLRTPIGEKVAALNSTSTDGADQNRRVVQRFVRANSTDSTARRPGSALGDKERDRARVAVDERYLTLQVNRIAQFLGICPFEKVPAVDAHQSGAQVVPATHRLNASVCRELQRFYRPFNALLDALLQGAGEETTGFSADVCGDQLLASDSSQ